MNFYHAYYKRQRYHDEEDYWEDTFYDRQGIIVIAGGYEDAKAKIENCLDKVETNPYRAVLVSDIVECVGLDRRHGFEWSFEVNPIFND